jgi:hypothetical protein
MDRNRFLMIAIVVIAVVFIFNPFGRRQPAERLYPSYVKKEVLDPIKADILARAEKPEDYVAGLFDRHDIVFLGEFPKIKQQVQFVSGLIPVLYRHGVTNLGIEHAPVGRDVRRGTGPQDLLRLHRPVGVRGV